MLETLHIENYALIDRAEVEFSAGFNALTGETGAGKSIIIGALNLVLGARASSEAVRDGAERARVNALFRVGKPGARLKAILDESAVTLEDGELLLSRVVNADGRSRGYVCGTLVPINVLAAIGDELVDLHGQHDHQSLLKPDRQLDLLDAFAGAEEQAALVADIVAALRSLERDIAELETDDRERARRVEFMKFEAEEIAAAGLQPDEEEELKSLRNRIANAERIVELSSHAYATLYEGGEATAIDAIDAAITDAEELADVDAKFRELADALASARAQVEAAALEFREFTDGIEFDPQELERINQRLALIGTLKRKYGDTVEAILEYHARAVDEVERYEGRDRHLAEMRAALKKKRDEAEAAADALSKKRTAAATKLNRLVTAALQDLGMKGGAFEIAFEIHELSIRGNERAEFMLAANPGAKPKPLRQVASGGEISRVMLAVKAVFAAADTIPTLIFDEIDAGVGGVVAGKVASKLRELSQSHQTICITHLPQIAAAAEHHYNVAKVAQKGKSRTTVGRVDGEERVAEVARLLDGAMSDTSVAHARELLAAMKG